MPVDYTIESSTGDRGGIEEVRDVAVCKSRRTTEYKGADKFGHGIRLCIDSEKVTTSQGSIGGDRQLGLSVKHYGEQRGGINASGLFLALVRVNSSSSPPKVRAGRPSISLAGLVEPPLLPTRKVRDPPKSEG